MGRKSGVIALFDMDGTLTPPRKVRRYISPISPILLRNLLVVFQIRSDPGESTLQLALGSVFFFFPFLQFLQFSLDSQCFLSWGSQEVSADMLQFLQALRKVCCLLSSLCKMCTIMMWHCMF
jgi:hypothetical protein